MELTVLDAAQVRSRLSMPACIAAMEAAMRAASQGRVTSPQRQMLPLEGGGIFALMPAIGRELGCYGAKVAGVHPDNRERGLPTIQGLVILFDHATGVPLSVMDGAEITAIRTAAASGLATRALARPGARTLGLFGTGVQAATHLDAMRAVRAIEEVRVWGIDRESATCFAESHASRTGLTVRAVATPQEAAACDIVCTVTNSITPVLAGAWVRPGAHVNLVGAHTLAAREADTDLIRSASVYVDLLASMKAEAGDIMIPVGERAITLDHVVGEIGQLLNGNVRGRRDETEITVYKSVGFAAQDLYAAASVLGRLRE